MADRLSAEFGKGFGHRNLWYMREFYLAFPKVQTLSARLTWSLNRIVNTIAGRLSLREPQRASLEILDRVCEIADPKKGAGLASMLKVIQAEYPSVKDFEREFPSLCFALATGVGKTRLMGAFIAYLHLTPFGRRTGVSAVDRLTIVAHDKFQD